jgi:hypothetical protein
MRITAAAITAASLGMMTGVAVTVHAHQSLVSPGWAERVGNTRLRRADLPVGGTALLLVSAVLRLAGRPRAAAVVAAGGMGAAAGAVGTGLARPLPPAQR